jgi:hypothetical protein
LPHFASRDEAQRAALQGERRTETGVEARSRTRTDDPFLTMAARGLRLFTAVQIFGLTLHISRPRPRWRLRLLRVLCCPPVAHPTCAGLRQDAGASLPTGDVWALLGIAVAPRLVASPVDHAGDPLPFEYRPTAEWKPECPQRSTSQSSWDQRGSDAPSVPFCRARIEQG